MATTYSTSDELEELLRQLSNNPTYNGKTAEQIRAQAENEYSSYYDQLRLSAQQRYDRNDLALQNQIAAMQANYDRQREESRKAYAKAYSQTDREILRRGMQRSSYGIQTLANLQQEGVEAQGDLDRAQASAEGGLMAQRTQLAEQLAEQLGQYDAGKASDILARIQELEDQDYARRQDSFSQNASIASKIYEYQRQEQADAQAQANWQATFDEEKRQFDAKNAGSSGGGGDGGGGATTPAATSPTAAPTDSWTSFMSSLSGDTQPTRSVSDIVAGFAGKAAGTIGKAAQSLMPSASTVGSSGLVAGNDLQMTQLAHVVSPAAGSSGLVAGNDLQMTQLARGVLPTQAAPTVKMLDGPVNKGLMDAANSLAPQTGLTFKSALEEALKKK